MEAKQKRGPWLVIGMIVIVVLAIAAFIVLRGNGGAPGTQPASRPLPQGAPAGK